MEFNPKWQTQSPHEAGITPDDACKGKRSQLQPTLPWGCRPNFLRFQVKLCIWNFYVASPDSFSW